MTTTIHPRALPTATVDPYEVAAAVVRAVAAAPAEVSLLAEPSSAMFLAMHALCGLADASSLHYRMSVHYGSMGHMLGGAVGFCAATGRRALVLTGDGSLHLMNPLPVAVKHGLRVALVVLNDARLSLPYIGAGSIGAHHAQATTTLPQWDFTRQGSALVGGRTVRDAAELDDAIAEALSFDGPFVVDALVDPDVVPPVGTRLRTAAEAIGCTVS